MEKGGECDDSSYFLIRSLIRRIWHDNMTTTVCEFTSWDRVRLNIPAFTKKCIYMPYLNQPNWSNRTTELLGPRKLKALGPCSHENLIKAQSKGTRIRKSGWSFPKKQGLLLSGIVKGGLKDNKIKAFKGMCYSKAPACFPFGNSEGIWPFTKAQAKKHNNFC